MGTCGCCYLYKLYAFIDCVLCAMKCTFTHQIKPACNKYDLACENLPCVYLKIADFQLCPINLITIHTNTTICLPLMQNLKDILVTFTEIVQNLVLTKKWLSVITA